MANTPVPFLKKKAHCFYSSFEAIDVHIVERFYWGPCNKNNRDANINQLPKWAHVGRVFGNGCNNSINAVADHEVSNFFFLFRVFVRLGDNNIIFLVCCHLFYTINSKYKKLVEQVGYNEPKGEGLI